MRSAARRLPPPGSRGAASGVKNTIFFDGVRVPAFNLIGGENSGWEVAGTHLEIEHGLLRSAVRSDRDPHTGEPVFSPATVAALLVFFVFALQCMSTLAIMRRETNSWRWPAFAFAYMLTLAYGASFAAHWLVTTLGRLT